MIVSLLLLLPVLLTVAEEDLKRWSNDEIEVIRTASPENGRRLHLLLLLGKSMTGIMRLLTILRLGMTVMTIHAESKFLRRVMNMKTVTTGQLGLLFT